MSIILGRFFLGDYSGLVRDQVDSSDLSVHSEIERAYLIGALVFCGRRQDAKAEFQAHRISLSHDARTIAQFFLGVGATRDSEYDEARRWFAENFRTRHEVQSAEAKFFVFQGFGFFRFYCSRFSKSVLWSGRAWRQAFAERFRYGMILSADLRGHGLVQSGRVSEGLKSLHSALDTVDSGGGVKAALEVSVICYRAQFGLLPRASLELNKRLRLVEVGDTYSRGNLILELARALVLEGRAPEALNKLEDGASEIFRHGHRRQKAGWQARKAHALLLRGKKAEALRSVEDGIALLEPQVDLAHRLELLDLRHRLQPEAGDKTEVACLTSATGKGVARQTLMRGVGRTVSGGDDTLGNLINRLSADPRDIEALLLVVKNGWLGLLNRLVESENGIVFYLDLLPGRLVTFYEGGVWLSDEAVSETLKRMLITLAQGPADKQKLIESVWGYKYSALRHDPVLYNTIYRLRQLLGSFEAFLVAANGAYMWTEKAAARVFERPATQGESLEDFASDGLNLRQHRALKMVKSETAISASDYARSLKVAKATATRDLAELVDKGYLAKTGRARATVYVLRNQEFSL